MLIGCAIGVGVTYYVLGAGSANEPAGYVTPSEVQSDLNSAGINPVGIPVSSDVLRDLQSAERPVTAQ